MDYTRIELLSHSYVGVDFSQESNYPIPHNRPLAERLTENDPHTFCKDSNMLRYFTIFHSDRVREESEKMLFSQVILNSCRDFTEKRNSGVNYFTQLLLGNWGISSSKIDVDYDTNRTKTNTEATSSYKLKFQSYIEAWHKERGATSSITDILMCVSYQKIIAMGADKVVPLILEQLEKEGDEPDFWFWALYVLTGENPITEDEKGNRPKVAKAWLRWAKGKYAW